MDTKVIVNKKQKASTKEQLEGMSREELIQKIIQLEAHNTQLKNILQKKLEVSSNINAEKKLNKRQFDFSKTHKRHILLKFLYFGWNYQGFACQEDSIETIEHHLFNALRKTCLIESRSTSNYNRCGRTDKGVSAYGQVISIDVRSKFPEAEQLEPENVANEIDYCNILNRVLPKEIRCIAWMPLKNKAYSARFDCIQRVYRYFFPKANLDIEQMKLACQYLIGTHDFRNLCKMDVNNGVTNFIRKILAAGIMECNVQNDKEEGYNMYYLEIYGQAFLWHQIRCIMAVLFLVGQKNEDPEVIKELLDVEKNPCKPQYSLASPLPLNLYACKFEDTSNQKGSDFGETEKEQTNSNERYLTEWEYSEENMAKVIEDLQLSWGLSSIQTTMMREVLADIQRLFNEKFLQRLFESQANSLQDGARQKVYQTLLSRKRCESLENRIDHYVKKQRLLIKTDATT